MWRICFISSKTLAVLQNTNFNHAELAKISSEIAIVGSITTENLGVEHLIKNLIANPFIRHLVIWGEDIDGHLPGNALVNLLRNGVDKTRRINGAKGARPVLKNITASDERKTIIFYYYLFISLSILSL